MNLPKLKFTSLLLLGTVLSGFPTLTLLAETESGLKATAQWPQFRGPNACGVAANAKPPLKIGPDSGVQWKIDVPWAPSSPSIWGDHIFLTAFDDDKLETRAYRRKDGKLLWKRGIEVKELEMFHRSDGSPAASTVATDGRHVVSYFGSFGLICHDFKGKELWRRPMPVALSGGSFGTGTSPIIAGKAVILQRDVRTNSKLIVLDVATGNPIWESPRPGANGSFGMPIVWKNKGVEELVVAGSSQLKGYSLETGKQRWVINGLSTFSCTTPVVAGEHLYYGAWCPGGADRPWGKWSDFQGTHDKNSDGQIAFSEFSEQARDFYRGLDVDADGTITEADWGVLEKSAARGKNMLIAVKPGGKEDITASHVMWKHTKGLPYVSCPLSYKGRIYLVRDGGIVSSLDIKTGKPFYSRERIPAGGKYYASPVAADDRIYLASLPGRLTVIKAGGDTPKILHETDFGERIFATPALVGDKLYLRTKTKLYAFGE
jgi:outer membrane protein assembly factor BamB